MTAIVRIALQRPYTFVVLALLLLIVLALDAVLLARFWGVVSRLLRRITGGALLARNRVVHLAAFQRHAASNPFDPLH